MATLDKVMELQSQGVSQNEIIQQLQNEGISPKEINDSINQASVKNAVAPQESLAPPAPGMAPTQEPAPQYDEQSGQNLAPPAPGQTPPTPEVYPSENQNYYSQTPQAYSGQEYYPPTTATDVETISEIVEQVVSEKLDEFRKQTGDIPSFHTNIQDKVSDIDDRLKRIESSIDKLQQGVIGKIGEFGESSAMIHKDLENLHGTVSKLMDPLMDNIKKLKKISK